MKRHIAFSVFLAVSVFLIFSCEEKNGPEIIYEQGQWVKDARSTAYFSIYPDELFPGVILQTEGVKRLYADSPFVQANFTEDLLMDIVNPGEGAEISLKMHGSDICNEIECSYEVAAGDTAQVLVLQVPVDWDYNTLLEWDFDRNVKLSWEVTIDGQHVQTFTKQFICRTLRSFIGSLMIEKNLPENAVIVEMLHNPEVVGSFPVTENDKTMNMHLSALLAGLIDETSPLIERLKGEVIEDGYVDKLTGMAGYTEEELLQNVDAYNYLMQKYNIHYATRSAGNAVQYLRTIDEIFENHNGYCAELGIAFVSWCLNLGVKCTFEAVPRHLTTSVYLPFAAIDPSTIEYPFDTTVSASLMSDYGAVFSTPPTESEFQESRDFFELVRYNSELREEKYEADMLVDSLLYYKFNPASLRRFLPSFNIGARDYMKTRAAVSAKSVRAASNPLWTGETSPVLEPVVF